MTVYSIVGASPLFERTYLVVRDSKALVVDPGVSADRVLSACAALSATPIAVLLTHGHADHILGARGLQKSGLKVYAAADEFDVISSRKNLALALGLTLEPLTPDVALHDGDTLDLAPFSVTVIATPGHTVGGVSYLIDGTLFSGDTLFAGSYGRTDFPTGDEMDLLCSITNTLFELPKETPVYAGHGADTAPSGDEILPAEADTTIGDEYYTNPILNLL